MKTAAVNLLRTIEVFQLVEYVFWKHEVAGSSPAFYTNVVAGLTGKAPHCESGEQGSSPGINRLATYRNNVSHKMEDTGSNPVDAKMV